jgi:hypothetical protein
MAVAAALACAAMLGAFGLVDSAAGPPPAPPVERVDVER